MADPIMDRIVRDRKEAQPPGTHWYDVKRYREYARGIQKGTLNADQVRIMQSVLQNKFADNVLRMILWIHANRLQIARYDVDDEAVSEFLFTTWVKNQLPDLFADTVFATLRDGNHGVSLGWIASDDPSDPYGGYVRLMRERWWNGTDGLFVKYQDDGTPEYAVKEWKAAEGWRRTIYFPGFILRYIQSGGAWRPYYLSPDEERSAIGVDAFGTPLRAVPWQKRDGTPLGIPVVHVPNGSDDDTYYGASLLFGGPLAFQDQINAVQHDITAASMFNGSPQTWSKGFPLPVDSTTGKPIPPKTGPGVHHHTEEVTSEWGVIQPGSLVELERAYLVKLRAVCRITDTPLHEITGDWPSGEALFRAEMNLVQATRNLAKTVGPAMATVAHRATEIANAFGTVDLDESALITTVFDPPEMRDDLSRWTVAEKAAPHTSRRYTLRVAGVPPQEIEQIIAEREEEQDRATERAMLTFSRGPNVVGTEEEEEE